MAQIFISFATSDGFLRAHQLAHQIAEAGMTVWISDSDVAPAQNYAESISRAIAECSVFVVVLTTGATLSPHVEREVHLAVTHRQKILAINDSDRRIPDLPVAWNYWLGTSQVVRSPSNDQLVALIATLLKDATAATPTFPTLRDALKNGVGREELVEAVQLGLVDVEIGLIDLSLHLKMHIEDNGSATLHYRHDVLNASGEPRGGLPQREVWFEHTARLRIAPTVVGGGHAPVRVKVAHDAGHVVKFLPRFQAPLPPGGRTTVAYSVSGGHFLEDHYWSQSFPRFTRAYTCEIRKVGGISWVEAARRDSRGDEREITDYVGIQHDADVSIARFSATYLSPGEVFTVRWEDRM